jgi:hypothetical protein
MRHRLAKSRGRLTRLGRCAGTVAGLGLGVWGFFLNPVTPSSIEPAVDLNIPIIVTAVLTIAAMFGGLLLGGFAAVLLCPGEPSRQDALLYSMDDSALLLWERAHGLPEAGLHPHSRVQEEVTG